MSSPETRTGLFSSEEADRRAALYLDRRIKVQLKFYQSRIEEFRLNSESMLIVSAVLMGISTAISVFSISAQNKWLLFVTAVLPAVAAAVASFQAVYQWERQHALYKDTLLQLRRATNVIAGLKADQYGEELTPLVSRAETVFRNEASQWGQLKGIMPTGADQDED